MRRGMVAKREHRCAITRTPLTQERCDDRSMAAVKAVEEPDAQDDWMLGGISTLGKRVLDVQTNTFRGASIVPCISPTPTSMRVMSRTNT